MSERPQFSLKALLVIIAVLGVPLGMMGSVNDLLFLLGIYITCVNLGGSVGYLLGGGKWALLGTGIGTLAAMIALSAFLFPRFQIG